MQATRTMNDTTIETMRAEYRAIRQASSLPTWEFDARVRGWAHEMADGEEITPAMLLSAARLLDKGEVY